MSASIGFTANDGLTETKARDAQKKHLDKLDRFDIKVISRSEGKEDEEEKEAAKKKKKEKEKKKKEKEKKRVLQLEKEKKEKEEKEKADAAVIDPIKVDDSSEAPIAETDEKSLKRPFSDDQPTPSSFPRAGKRLRLEDMPPKKEMNEDEMEIDIEGPMNEEEGEEEEEEKVINYDDPLPFTLPQRYDLFARSPAPFVSHCSFVRWLVCWIVCLGLHSSFSLFSISSCRVRFTTPSKYIDRSLPVPLHQAIYESINQIRTIFYFLLFVS